MSCLSNLSDRINMASYCMQLCLQCRRLLTSKPVARAWHASLGVSWSHKTTWTRHRWMQQMLFFNGCAVKHLSTDTKEKKGVEEMSITDIVAYKRPLLPVRDAVPDASVSQMPIGKYWSDINFKENY